MPNEVQLTPAPTGRGITPERPIEPPQEVKDMTFKLDDKMFEDKGDGTTITNDKGVALSIEKPEVQKVAETTKSVEAPKEEVNKPKQEVVTEKKEEKKSVLTPPKSEEKKVETTAKAGESKPVIKPITPVKEKSAEADTFDYSKFSPQDQLNLKNMSRQSREAYVKLLDENKQLSSLKDANYLQHEEGYTLSPQYKELRQKDYFARTEGKCWYDALLNIKAGKPFKPIVGWNKDGSPALGAEQQPTDQDEIIVQNNLTACQQASNQINGELQTYPNQFKQRITQDLQEINNERHNRFAWVQDPKLLEYSVEVEGKGQQKIGDIKKDFKSLFPPYLANSVGVDVASDMMVALMIQSAELRVAQQTSQVATIKVEEAKRGEPSSDNSDTGIAKGLNGKGVPSVFSLEGMPER